MNVTTNTGFTVTDAVWYTPSRQIVGIVRGQTAHGEEKFYIGTGFGSNEETDAKYIAENGSRFYPEIFDDIDRISRIIRDFRFSPGETMPGDQEETMALIADRVVGEFLKGDA